MCILLDSENQIALAQIAKFLTKYSYRVINENGVGKNLLECAGLSALAEKYEYELQPYSFNGSWKNDNANFNPENAIPSVCSEIKENKQALGKFLNEFFSRIQEIDAEDLRSVQNYLEVIGYQLKIEDKSDYYTKYNYVLIPATEGVLERQKEISYMASELKQNFSDLVTYYEEAISTYGNSEYKGCIGNCRTLFEKLFKAVDPEVEFDKKDYAKGILKATKETVSGGNTPRLSQKGIFTYWLDYKKGFNRYRLFTTMYSLMSALGPHGEEILSKEDALLCLRVTEDILIWHFRENKS